MKEGAITKSSLIYIRQEKAVSCGHQIAIRGVVANVKLCSSPGRKVRIAGAVNKDARLICGQPRLTGADDVTDSPFVVALNCGDEGLEEDFCSMLMD